MWPFLSSSWVAFGRPYNLWAVLPGVPQHWRFPPASGSHPPRLIPPSGGLGLLPGAWGAPKRGMPTEPKVFLALPGACGLRPCDRTHLKTALCHIRALVGRFDKYRGLRGRSQGKVIQHKIIIQHEEINQKVLTKEGRFFFKYLEKVKQYRKSRTFQNNERKFYRQIEGDDTKTYQQPDSREAEQFWSKIWKPREHNKKSEWIGNMAKDLEGLEEGPKAEIHIDLLRTTLKRYLIGKCHAMMEYMDSGLRNSPPFMID